MNQPLAHTFLIKLACPASFDVNETTVAYCRDRAVRLFFDSHDNSPQRAMMKRSKKFSISRNQDSHRNNRRRVAFLRPLRVEKLDERVVLNAHMPAPNFTQIGTVDLGGAEIPAFDSVRDRMFVAAGGQLEIVNVSDPSNPTALDPLDIAMITEFGDGSSFSPGDVNSVAYRDGLVAIAVAADPKTDPGAVAIFDAGDLMSGGATAVPLNVVAVGSLPDMLTFTPSGLLLVANEGESNDEDNDAAATPNPEGSVSVIDVSAGVAAATVATANFNAFDGMVATLVAEGVRLFPEVIDGTITVSQDLEPEYIAFDDAAMTALVTLQENNALAILNYSDPANPVITEIVALGSKNHSLPGNSLDPSDKDSGIQINNWPVFGLYMPDAIASYQVGGETYYITANEGDSRTEDARIKDLTLDPTVFPDAAALQGDEQIGRLEVSTIDGDPDGDGDYDALFAYGSRSFTIWDSTGSQIFDSGDQIEKLTAAAVPGLFNSNGAAATFDTRSDSKGAEPEGVTVGQIDGRTYAFVGLERTGGVLVYDVTDPTAPRFTQYLNTPGDVSPEGLVFISAADSPNGKPILGVTNEVSSTLTLYSLSELFTLQVLHASDLEGGVDALERAANFAAIIDRLEDEDLNPFSSVDGSITLSAGDNYIPGPFFNAAGDLATFRTGGVFNDVYNSLFGVTSYNALREGAGRADISIMNVIGFDASAIGNHEFDLGSGPFAEIIASDFRSPSGPAGDRWVGAQFPYLSANLDFSGDASLRGLFTDQLLPSTSFRSGPAESAAGMNAVKKIAPYTLIEAGGQLIGVVAATTPLLDSITSPSGTEVKNPGAGSNDMAALASILQPAIDTVLAAGVNKVVLATHLQQIALEQELIPLLSGVDISIAGGSDTLLANPDDPLAPGDMAVGGYPIVTADADGNPAVIVSTDGEYSYVGRLVVNFNEMGILVDASGVPIDGLDDLDLGVNGPIVTDSTSVAALWGTQDPFAEGTKGQLVQELVDAVQAVVIAQDGNVIGQTSVYLDGRRTNVRTEETNLGNLTADANLAVAQDFDPSVVISLKNGGGIRAPIGEIDSEGNFLPPQANPLSGKRTGQISQLDIDNSLRFNNGLTLVTLTAEQLLQVIEHSVAGSGGGNTPGQFAQVGGLSFSFDTSRPAGNRVTRLERIDDDGNPIQLIAENGKLVINSFITFRLVTLNFLADGGDNYPFPQFQAANPLRYHRVDLLNVLTDPGLVNFARPGSEQDALAEFLASEFPIGGPDSFDDAEMAAGLDQRIRSGDFNPILFTSSALGEVTLQRVGDNVVVTRGAEVLLDKPLDALNSVSIIGDAGANVLNYVLTGGEITVSVSFDGRGGAADKLNVLVDGGNDVVHVDTTVVSVLGSVVSHANVEQLNLHTGLGDDTVVVTASQAALNIIDPSGFDTLDFSGASSRLFLNLALNRGQLQTALGTTRIGLQGDFEAVIGTAQADQIRGSAVVNNVLLGLGGNDQLFGVGGNNVLVGGFGDDLLFGGNQQDVIIGGDGRDQLQGQGGEDLLIGGTTSFDDDIDALMKILDEWTSGNSFPVRQSHLTNGGGLNDPVLLQVGVTVFDDGDRDSLFGGLGDDWLLGFPGDFLQ
jgi:2',3'-cyclic-nucleotide 2'-phosphodiesterase (5'-nucleotidase family)